MEQNRILIVDGQFRKLEGLKLISNFPFQEMLSKEGGEELAKVLLSTILDKKIDKVKVTPQKNSLGDGTGRQGIRLDVYVEATLDEAEKNTSATNNDTNDTHDEDGGDDEEYDEGYDDGFDDGQDRVNLLNIILTKAGRLADIIKAAGDKPYQEKLFEEFNL